ncbi:unnamed protein product [Tilletia controversa]|nr:unnamed protein product [Tilletia controversa]CAD6961969.1 unnamed protein product [Tilletia controversa]CAD6970474.1 unnamed protein product [Tilletia controversa]
MTTRRPDVPPDERAELIQTLASEFLRTVTAAKRASLDLSIHAEASRRARRAASLLEEQELYDPPTTPTTTTATTATMAMGGSSCFSMLGPPSSCAAHPYSVDERNSGGAGGEVRCGSRVECADLLGCQGDGDGGGKAAAVQGQNGQPGGSDGERYSTGPNRSDAASSSSSSARIRFAAC